MTNVQKNIIPLNKAIIDSLSLKIKLSDVIVLDERLTSSTAIYYESLDAVDDELKPPQPIIFTKNGITVRFKKVSIPIYEKLEEKVSTDFVDLTMSAKLLRENYFQGISKNTVEFLYNAFIDFGVFTCEYDTFLNAMVTDIDIAINRHCPTPVQFSSVLDCLYEQTGELKKHLKKFNDKQSTNLGLNFNQRSFAKPSLPFVKLYHKELELKHKSSDFFDNYLQHLQSEIQGLTRIEATIKNYDHKRRLAKYEVLPMFRTLNELLEIEETKLYDFVCFCIGSYVNKQARLKSPNLSPNDHLIFELMQNCIRKGYDFEMLYSIADTFKGSTPESGEVAKTRMRKKITELYQLADKIEDEQYRIWKHNRIVTDYLKSLKINLFDKKYITINKAAKATKKKKKK
jgi:hypothetical protein